VSLAAFLGGPVLEVAPALLGRTVTTGRGSGVTTVVLTEVEAYAGSDDPASHAHRGRTGRNGSMFQGPGTLYVYRSYGIHWCMNVVCGQEGDPSAVLLRAGDPIAGVELMRARRARSDHLADGPGKLTQALGVTGAEDGTSVLDGPIRLGDRVRDGEVITTPRIGISKATEREWRFVLR
jgi:DNA-3-methyladenine glycosylase